MPSGGRKHPYRTTTAKPRQHSRWWALVPLLYLLAAVAAYYLLGA